MKHLGLKRLPSADAIGDWRRGKAGGVYSVQQIDKEMIRPYLKSLSEEITVDAASRQLAPAVGS